MAGYSKIYCIDGLGGFMGADGINPILVQIWVGDSDRQWLEARYFDPGIKPIGNIKVIVPEGPAHPNALLDACIAFFPQAFTGCPTMPVVVQKLGDVERLDFHLGQEQIPQEWYQLRREAVEQFHALHIFEAELTKLQPQLVVV